MLWGILGLIHVHLDLSCTLMSMLLRKDTPNAQARRIIIRQEHDGSRLLALLTFAVINNSDYFTQPMSSIHSLPLNTLAFFETACTLARMCGGKKKHGLAKSMSVAGES